MAIDFSNWLQTTHPLRAEGTKLKVGNRTYDFRRNVLGHYVAEVLDAVDRTTILSICAAYQPYRPSADEARDLVRSAAGVPGVDSGELDADIKARDDANIKAGQAAAASVPKPAKRSAAAESAVA